MMRVATGFYVDRRPKSAGVSKLLENNKKWAATIAKNDPTFFTELAQQQAPEYLWIGCSDSRVPSTQITGVDPGTIFTHRNVANVVYPNDFNLLAVLQYSVDVLKVKHVIICGHYGCGGVRAAYEGTNLGLVDGWISAIRDVAFTYRQELFSMPEEKRIDRLCELNVVEQVRRVARMTVVTDAWRRTQTLSIHGLIYGINDGVLKEVGAVIRGLDQVSVLYKGDRPVV